MFLFFHMFCTLTTPMCFKLFQPFKYQNIQLWPICYKPLHMYAKTCVFSMFPCSSTAESNEWVLINLLRSWHIYLNQACWSKDTWNARMAVCFEDQGWEALSRSVSIIKLIVLFQSSKMIWYFTLKMILELLCSHITFACPITLLLCTCIAFKKPIYKW